MLYAKCVVIKRWGGWQWCTNKWQWLIIDLIIFTQAQVFSAFFPNECNTGYELWVHEGWDSFISTQNNNNNNIKKKSCGPYTVFKGQDETLFFEALVRIFITRSVALHSHQVVFSYAIKHPRHNVSITINNKIIIISYDICPYKSTVLTNYSWWSVSMEGTQAQRHWYT